MMSILRRRASPSGAPRRLAAAWLLSLALSLPSWSQGLSAPDRLTKLDSLLPAGIASELSAKGKVLRLGSATSGTTITPAYRGAADIAARVSAEKPSLVIEAIYAFKRPRPADPAAELRSLYGTLLEVHSLEGIEYWSASRQKMRVLYTESWRIDNPEARNRLPDALPPQSGMPPREARYFAYQRDNVFGPNLYRLSYLAYADGVLLESVNLTTLSYLGIPVLKPEGLKIRLLVIQAEEAIVFYIVNSGDLPDIPIIKDRVETSIANRAEALYTWFMSRDRARDGGQAQ